MHEKPEETSSPPQNLTSQTASTAAVYFNGPSSERGYLCQWHQQRFKAPAALLGDPATPTAPSSSSSSSSSAPTPEMITFQAAEQYMMYRKALLFSDTQTASQILQAHEPAEQKQLGRKVRNFDRKVWDREKLKIVEEGNFWKFSDVDAGKIRRWLLETGERELIEASSDDRIWGVGFLPENAEANRSHWGQNLLGIALMGVRKRIREQEAAST